VSGVVAAVAAAVGLAAAVLGGASAVAAAVLGAASAVAAAVLGAASAVAAAGSGAAAAVSGVVVAVAAVAVVGAPAACSTRWAARAELTAATFGLKFKRRLFFFDFEAKSRCATEDEEGVGMFKIFR
jgi:hypothetical protein